MLLQELIETYYRDPAQEEALLGQLHNALFSQPLVIAYHPATRHPYLFMENGIPTAAVFYDDEGFARFADAVASKGARPVPHEVDQEKRTEWAIMLVRCGIQRIMIGYLPRCLNVAITDICVIPDQRALPLYQRTSPAPSLTGSMLLLSQGIADSTATGEDTIRFLRVLYHSAYLVPTKDIEGALVPIALERGGKSYLPVFTDRTEWESSGLFRDAEIGTARIADLMQYEAMGCSGVVLDPSTGIEISLDKTLLTAAENAVTGQTEDMVLRSLREEPEAVQVFAPENVPETLLDTLTTSLQDTPTVRAAWLRAIRTPESIRPHYLLALDCGGERLEKPLVRSLVEKLLPCSEGWDIEVTASEKVGMFLGDAKPVYRRKRFGIL